MVCVVGLSYDDDVRALTMVKPFYILFSSEIDIHVCNAVQQQHFCRELVEIKYYEVTITISICALPLRSVLTMHVRFHRTLQHLPTTAQQHLPATLPLNTTQHHPSTHRRALLLSLPLTSLLYTATPCGAGVSYGSTDAGTIINSVLGAYGIPSVANKGSGVTWALYDDFDNEYVFGTWCWWCNGAVLLICMGWVYSCDIHVMYVHHTLCIVVGKTTARTGSKHICNTQYTQWIINTDIYTHINKQTNKQTQSTPSRDGYVAPIHYVRV